MKNKQKNQKERIDYPQSHQMPKLIKGLLCLMAGLFFNKGWWTRDRALSFLDVVLGTQPLESSSDEAWAGGRVHSQELNKSRSAQTPDHKMSKEFKRWVADFNGDIKDATQEERVYEPNKDGVYDIT